MTDIIERRLETLVAGDLQDIEAVFINGGRQTGKSTFVTKLGERYTNVAYFSFDDISLRAAETMSPGRTFEGIEEGLVILDEIQFVPDTFLALKSRIDSLRREKRKLKFLLTGSADIMLLPNLANALVGRMYVRTMYPFSAAEILAMQGTFLRKMLTTGPDMKQSFSKPSFAKIVPRATFPRLSLNIKDKSQWCQNYISTLIERDVKNLSDIDRMELIPQLLSILANRTGRLVNDADISIALKISQPTLKRYRTLLDGVFLTFLLPPWQKKLKKRFIKSPKVYFNDTMLLCHILGFSPAEILSKRPDLYGFVLENFVASELRKQLSIMGDGSALYHFRTSDQKEIDFLVEGRDGSLLALEVKAANTVLPADFRHIRFLQNALPDNIIRGIIIYQGDKAVQFDKNLFALPLSALWEM
jgi:predicted AAA+ superfamily ATPase